MFTDQTKRGPAVEFNPYAPGYDVDPYPALEKLRQQAPILYWEQGRGWLLSRHDDVLAVLRDNKRFTPDRSVWEFNSVLGTDAVIPELTEISKDGLFSLPNADHARVRKLVSPALTPRAIDRLHPDIQGIVDEILTEAAAKGTVNLVTDIAERIPARVIGSMLKIPKGREELFQDFTNAAIASFIPALLSPEKVEGLRKDVREGIALVRETIEDRRRNPLENDILTTLIQTEEQGDKLNTGELLSLVAALIVGGFETTIHLIGFTTYNILKRPELHAQVRANPELIQNVIEEVLRFDNFGKMGITRYALEDVEIGGVKIRKGQQLILLLNSALRDENAFSKSEVFDVSRNTSSNLAFGHGAHFCIGSNLARLEVRIAVNTLIQRFPELRLVKEPAFGPHPVIRKMDVLEVRLR